MRVEAAPSARFALIAPRVMLPASTTCRNRLRSTRSKCIVFVLREGTLRHTLIALGCSQTYCFAIGEARRPYREPPVSARDMQVAAVCAARRGADIARAHIATADRIR